MVHIRTYSKGAALVTAGYIFWKNILGKNLIDFIFQLTNPKKWIAPITIYFSSDYEDTYCIV